MYPTSPIIVDASVEKLLDLLNAEFEPEIVPVEVDPDGIADSCYYNVQRKIAKDGGKIHYGWVIWKSDLLCQAEHHAVWEDDNNDLHCVSPRPFLVSTIMFVPDNSKVYEGISYDNVRLNITGNPIIDDFIEVTKINELLFALGNRSDEMTIMLPVNVAQEIKQNEALLNNMKLFHSQGGRPVSPCFCGSNKKYQDCHGNNIVPWVRDRYNAIKANLIQQNANK